MFKTLVQESIHEMHNDVKIIRLTFLTSFFHSLIVILIIILNLNSLIARHYENGLYIGKVAQFFVNEISKNHVVNIVIVITICLFVMYSVIYPVGQAAIIHYLHEKKGMKLALKKGLRDFFPMFEFSAISMVTAPAVFFLIAFKLTIIDGDTGLGMLGVLLLQRVLIVIINTYKAYTRYCITLEDLTLGESLKRSIYLCKTHFRDSMKYMRVQTMLLINFSINLILLVGIPLLMMYLAIKFQVTDILAVKLILYIVFFFLIIVSAYMSSFIRAFFASYRYKLYKDVKNG